MAANEALVVVEDWISEHYFTAETKGESFHARVIARRKEWDEAEEGVATPRSRFTAKRGEIETDLAGLYDGRDEDSDTTRVWSEADRERIHAIYARVRTILGFRTGEYVIETTGPVEWFGTHGVAGRPFVLITATPVATLDEIASRSATTLLDPYVTDGADPIGSVATLLSTLFVADDGPEFALVQAGRWLVVADRGRWPEGRCLGIDLQLVAERNDTKRGGEIDTALTCVAAASLAPDAEGSIWWTAALADSVKHTVGVSKDLREGVRRSIEIIANDVVSRRRGQGLDPLPPDQAQPLAVQSLRFLYRILFLLYAEASPELGVLPVGAPEYTQGYGLDRLRELVLVELTSPRARTGTHFYASLHRLFELVDRGHRPRAAAANDSTETSTTLEFNSLRADLFRPQATALIDEVGLSNQAMQDVLQRLLLSQKRAGKERGFISYVDLGINQLGAVYEGLMSYTGFFATEDLFEVAKDGNGEKGSWVVPVDRADGIDQKDFVRVEDTDTGELKPVLHRQGTFVYRLSGRERQQSASYYTPEVLTRFTVGQALEELLDQDGANTTAEEILSLSVCEPALGSGAFAIEAVRQLAEQYLTRRQTERGETIPPDAYPGELQRVKAYIALHQVHGVDLNATAVELAEISLWLDTMAQGLQAPWFGLRLRRGNSLIGARHAVYARNQVNDKSWLVAPPTDVLLTELVAASNADRPVSGVDGRIHHFLLPAAGWGATSEAKEAKELSPDATEAVRQWRKRIKAKPTKTELDQLVELSRRVERLWQLAHRRLVIAEQESHRDIPLWGRDVERHGSTVSREQIEESLADPEGAYQRLRMIMDAWCALWFWPLRSAQADPDTRDPPSLAEWIATLQAIVGRDPEKSRKLGMDTLASATDWDSLGAAERNDLDFATAQPISRVLDDHPWLAISQRVAAAQGFLHWELDFAPIFGRGGFDLQIGNPPWVRPDIDVDALLAEGDPWWQLANKPSEALRQRRRQQTLMLGGIQDLVVSAVADTIALREAVSDATRFPLLAGLRPDLYRCFMATVWSNASHRGTVGLIHPETHFTDEKASRLRSATYGRLRRHWQFINELQLYEVDHHVSYGVHVYSRAHDESRFINASGLYHPETIERSLAHDGSGAEPGFKDEAGHWDQRPHRGRIVEVTPKVLATWHEVLEDESVPVDHTRMLYTVNRSAATVLAKLASASRLGSLGLRFSVGWNEKTDREKGNFVQEWGVPSSWREVIFQGPHFHVNTPIYKTPNKTMLHNLDWSVTDLETLPPDAIPVTAYKPAGDPARYDAAYTHWGDDGEIAARDHYRVAWRRMAANTGERTLISALLPPGVAHVHPVSSAGILSSGPDSLLDAQASLSTLLADFGVRSAPKGDIHLSTIARLPLFDPSHTLAPAARVRILRLNCLTDTYSHLWNAAFHICFAQDDWSLNSHAGLSPFRQGLTKQWSDSVPLRRAVDRRQAQVEIDALVALMLGVSADELCSVYRTQFAVLYRYDHWDYTYDVNGRVVPNSVLSVWRKKNDSISEVERTATNQAGNTYVYELPFRIYDREDDMRRAYAEFERRMAAS